MHSKATNDPTSNFKFDGNGKTQHTRFITRKGSYNKDIITLRRWDYSGKILGLDRPKRLAICRQHDYSYRWIDLFQFPYDTKPME
jgi:hypothetical protein